MYSLRTIYLISYFHLEEKTQPFNFIFYFFFFTHKVPISLYDYNKTSNNTDSKKSVNSK